MTNGMTMELYEKVNSTKLTALLWLFHILNIPHSNVVPLLMNILYSVCYVVICYIIPLKT